MKHQLIPPLTLGMILTATAATGQQSNPTLIGNWTWLTGSNTTGMKGAYGNLSLAAAGNTPGGRYGQPLVFDPLQRVLYLFGGLGFGQSVGTYVLTSPASFPFEI